MPETTSMVETSLTAEHFLYLKRTFLTAAIATHKQEDIQFIHVHAPISLVGWVEEALK